jgi:hypothetical protein
MLRRSLFESARCGFGHIHDESLAKQATPQWLQPMNHCLKRSLEVTWRNHALRLRFGPRSPPPRKNRETDT